MGVGSNVSVGSVEPAVKVIRGNSVDVAVSVGVNIGKRTSGFKASIEIPIQ